ncbi:HWE histidine kinase domain-containing protein [Methylopila musalis]|uniref:Blue-light-activated histidine kinase n=1 Tax=Methylopila musalis TaxID=1134781 RepID=A0ABW3Z7N6_9HYPH
MAVRIRDHDWSSTPFGPIDDWPPALRIALGLCLNSSYPTAIYWGDDLRLLYNDAWSPIPADRHPWSLGRPAAEVWRDIWPIVGPQFEQVVATGRGVSVFDQMLPMDRGGRLAETYWNYSFTPILDDSTGVVGVLNQGHETTDLVRTAQSREFLFQAADRIRAATAPGARPGDVLSSVLPLVGNSLSALRVGYVDVNGERDVGELRGLWSAGADALKTGPLPLGALGWRDAEDGTFVAEDLADDHAFNRGVASRLVAPVARGGRVMAALFVDRATASEWSVHDRHAAREVADRLWLGHEQATSLWRLRESEARLSAIFGQSAVGLSEMALDGRFLRVNGAMARLLGRSPETLRQVTMAQLAHPDDRDDIERRFARAVQTGEAFDLEERCLRPDGSATWAVSNVTVLVDEGGGPSGFFGVTADVTDRREAERMRSLLLAELNHRVKNNLATVQALARQTQRSAVDLEDFQTTFNARLMALSRAHDLLMRETWSSAQLIELAAVTLAPFGVAAGRVTVGGDPVRLSPTAAVTMTMALHELASNAQKYGALSVPNGQVALDWTIGDDGRRLEMAWRETGGPQVSEPARRGYGCRLIERGIVQELGGEARIDFAPEGVACTLLVPLSQKVLAQ